MLTCNLDRTVGFVADHIGHMYVGDAFPCRARLEDSLREMLLSLPECGGLEFSSVDPAGVVVLPIIHVGATQYTLGEPFNKKYTKRDHKQHYINWSDIHDCLHLPH